MLTRHEIEKKVGEVDAVFALPVLLDIATAGLGRRYLLPFLLRNWAVYRMHVSLSCDKEAELK